VQQCKSATPLLPPRMFQASNAMWEECSADAYIRLFKKTPTLLEKQQLDAVYAELLPDPTQAVPEVPTSVMCSAASATTEGAQLQCIGSFFPADRFAGAKAGYTFKRGQQGLGYYLDQPRPRLGPSVNASTPPRQLSEADRGRSGTPAVHPNRYNASAAFAINSPYSLPDTRGRHLSKCSPWKDATVARWADPTARDAKITMSSRPPLLSPRRASSPPHTPPEGGARFVRCLQGGSAMIADLQSAPSSSSARRAIPRTGLGRTGGGW